MASPMGDLACGAPLAAGVGSSEFLTHRERPMKATIFQLRDIDEEVVQSWKRHFKGVENVNISGGDIFELKADAIVSPANSFGYMDGGIDLVYINRFGWELQTRLQSHLKEQHDGELPVGQATIVETFDAEIPFLVSAPTMRIPMNVSNTLNAYLAFRAAIRAVRQHNNSDASRSEKYFAPDCAPPSAGCRPISPPSRWRLRTGPVCSVKASVRAATTVCRDVGLEAAYSLIATVDARHASCSTLDYIRNGCPNRVLCHE